MGLLGTSPNTIGTPSQQWTQWASGDADSCQPEGCLRDKSRKSCEPPAGSDGAPNASSGKQHGKTEMHHTAGVHERGL